MPRIRKQVLGSFVGGVLVAIVVNLSHAASPSETLLPETTVAFVSVTNVQKLVDQFNSTQIGQLMQDPVMEPFVKDLHRQLDERWTGIFDKIGLTIDDVRGVASGEAAVGLLEPGDGQAPLVVLVDVTDNVDGAKWVLEKVSANLTREGAKKSQVEAAGAQVSVFDLPEDDQGPLLKRAVYLLKDELLIASDSVEVVKGILARLGGEKTAVLADVKPFQQVTQRLRKDVGEGVPQLRWYLQPLGYFKAIRSLEDQREQRSDKTFLETFEEQGFDAIQGAGGQIDFAVDDYQIIHRSVVYAPKPHEKAMKMLNFLNGEEFTPQPWVPRDVASYTTAHADLLAAFDNFGPLFDALFGEGETGVWLDVLDSLKEDPHGPQIDLREELVRKLDNRVSLVTAYQLPVTTSSERILIAIKAANEKEVTESVRKTLEDDKEIRKRQFEQYVIWEVIPPTKAKVPAVSLDFPGMSGERRRSTETEEQRLFPNAAVTVAFGQLLVASHYDFLTEILKQTDERLSLARTIDYQQVASALEKLGADKSAGRRFSRMDEVMRPTYELIRQGKMPQSESMLGRILNSLFGADKAGKLREPEIEGSKMPDYEVVRRYLGPSGLFATAEEDGWFIKGMMLGK